MDESSVNLNYHIGDNNLADMSTTQDNDEQQQQVVEISSDEDSSCSYELKHHKDKENNYSSGGNNNNNSTDDETEDVKTKTPSRNNSKHRLPTHTTAQSNFIRSSAITTSSSRRRSSRRVRNLANTSRGSRRQVRFQPIPQSINISGHSSSSSNDTSANDNDESLVSTPTTGPKVKASYSFQAATSKAIAHRSQYFVGKLKQHKAQLAAAKPLAKKLHKNLRSMNFNKIKLKSFNNLAHSLHQQFSSSSASTSGATSKGFSPSHEADSCHNSTPKFKSVRKLDGSPPFDNKSEYCKQQNNTDTNCDQEEDFGWGSDFDDQSVDSSLASSTGGCNLDSTQPAVTKNGGGYLLEIGKSSCDFRAIEDVIQDQGICGQFKRLDLSESTRPMISTGEISSSQCQLAAGAASAPLKPPPMPTYQLHKVAPLAKSSVTTLSCPKTIKTEVEDEVEQQAEDDQEVDVDDDDDDDEAELRSLEARQGFRQIRDKLKIILDQRLATYKQTVVSSTTTSTSGVKTSKSEHQQHKSAASIESQSSAARSQPVDSVVTIQVSADKHQHQSQHHMGACRSDKSSPTGCAGSGAEFDCQSHCSDESSVASGTDSNHSGSQDSGHSTQHSGYSCIGHHDRGHHNHHHDHCARSATESPMQSVSSASVTCDTETPQALATTTIINVSRSCPRSTGGQISLSPNGSTKSDELAERKSRFLQNRMIINSKLESLFNNPSGNSHKIQSTSPREKHGSQPVAAATTGGETSPSYRVSCSGQPPPPPGSGRTVVVLASEARVASSLAGQQQQQQQQQLDPETRLKLLEQQRQMSLKLKQKPRRKTARRVFNLNGDGNCAGQPPAMSLRQLVKTVIDDCEKPAKLSSLTRSILNRSDSLSSDLAADDEANGNSTSSSSSDLNSRRQLDNCHQLAHQHQAAITEAIGSPACVQQITIEPRHSNGYLIYQHQQQQFQSTPQRIYEQPSQCLDVSIGANQTVSSIGTIDGLEYGGRANRTAGSYQQARNSTPQAPKANGLVNHFVTISNRRWKSCHLRTSLMQINAFGANETSQVYLNPVANVSHNISSISSGKQHLAYLDNSRNFFTDDDN